MIYLDTHVVAWLYAGEVEHLGRTARRLLNGDDILVSPAAILELEYLHEIGRLTVSGNTIIQGLAVQIGLRVCELSFAAVVASALDLAWTRDPFDRLIVAQADLAASVLVTKDENIRRHYKNGGGKSDLRTQCRPSRVEHAVTAIRRGRATGRRRICRSAIK